MLTPPHAHFLFSIKLVNDTNVNELGYLIQKVGALHALQHDGDRGSHTRTGPCRSQYMLLNGVGKKVEDGVGRERVTRQD